MPHYKYRFLYAHVDELCIALDTPDDTLNICIVYADEFYTAGLQHEPSAEKAFESFCKTIASRMNDTTLPHEIVAHCEKINGYKDTYQKACEKSKTFIIALWKA